MIHPTDIGLKGKVLFTTAPNAIRERCVQALEVELRSAGYRLHTKQALLQSSGLIPSLDAYTQLTMETLGDHNIMNASKFHSSAIELLLLSLGRPLLEQGDILYNFTDIPTTYGPSEQTFLQDTFPGFANRMVDVIFDICDDYPEGEPLREPLLPTCIRIPTYIQRNSAGVVNSVQIDGSVVDLYMGL